MNHDTTNSMQSIFQKWQSIVLNLESSKDITGLVDVIRKTTFRPACLALQRVAGVDKARSEILKILKAITNNAAKHNEKIVANAQNLIKEFWNRGFLEDKQKEVLESDEQTWNRMVGRLEEKKEVDSLLTFIEEKGFRPAAVALQNIMGPSFVREKLEEMRQKAGLSLEIKNNIKTILVELVRSGSLQSLGEKQIKLPVRDLIAKLASNISMKEKREILLDIIQKNSYNIVDWELITKGLRDFQEIMDFILYQTDRLERDIYNTFLKYFEKQSVSFTIARENVDAVKGIYQETATLIFNKLLPYDTIKMTRFSSDKMIESIYMLVFNTMLPANKKQIYSLIANNKEYLPLRRAAVRALSNLKEATTIKFFEELLDKNNIKYAPDFLLREKIVQCLKEYVKDSPASFKQEDKQCQEIEKLLLRLRQTENNLMVQASIDDIMMRLLNYPMQYWENELFTKKK